MNLLRIRGQQSYSRSSLHLLLRASYATSAAYVPHGAQISPPRLKPKPESKTFYTGRSTFHDTVLSLEDSVKQHRRSLKEAQLYPLPSQVRSSLPPVRSFWKDVDGLFPVINLRLRTAQYRRITGLLDQLNDLRNIAQAAGRVDLEQNLNDALAIYERDNKAMVLAGGRKPVELDEYGRSYTLGKRKESAARVWIIPVQQPSTPEAPVPTSSILVNNQPLASYFPSPVDRERALRPLKIAGLLGAFNIFALIRGGGTSGQAGALAHGIAKGLAAHVPDVRQILHKAKLTRRDPRMVERKKTGLAKARKRYTWVKR